MVCLHSIDLNVENINAVYLHVYRIVCLELQQSLSLTKYSYRINRGEMSGDGGGGGATEELEEIFAFTCAIKRLKLCK